MRKLVYLGLLIGLLGAGCADDASVKMPGGEVKSPEVSVTSTATSTAPIPKPTSAKTIKSAPKTVTVDMKDNAFAPQVIAINPGDTVVWTNKGKNNHTSAGANGALLWDSGTIKPGESYRYTFASAGRYEYHCGIHPMMTGTVVVGTVIPSP